MADLDRQLLQQLYKKGLIHLDVPIRPNDHVSIPPLEVLICLNSDSPAFSSLCLLMIDCMHTGCLFPYKRDTRIGLKPA